MNIDLIFPVLPPTLDGIGDHTVHLAQSLRERGCTVRVLTAQRTWSSLSGVSVYRAFDLDRRRGILDLVNFYKANPTPDWLLIQFEQFSYGRWGLNPFLPLAVRRIQRMATDLRVAIMFHEDFMPASSLKTAIMSSWQRVQFRMLGSLADVAFFSTEAWADEYANWFSRTSVHHLPVGSNIPVVSADRMEERVRLGIDPNKIVIGLFGSAHPSRLLTHVGAAVQHCLQQSLDVQLLYIGADGKQVRHVVGLDTPMLDAGPLPADEVSRCFTAMDLYLAPFVTGVSTRRGSFLAGLQHGIATVTTQGEQTGQLLNSEHQHAFLAPSRSDEASFTRCVRRLVQDAEIRKELGHRGKCFYDQYFSWERLATGLSDALMSHRSAEDTRSA